MSRPKAWNGSQWVDPAFWTGSEWKSYIPAAYDVPRWQYPYTAGPEGWVRAGTSEPAGWAGGQLVLDGTVDGGIWGYAAQAEYTQDVNDVGGTVMEPPNLWAIKTRFRIVATSPFQEGQNMPIVAQWPYGAEGQPEIDYRYSPQVGTTDTGWVDVTTPATTTPTYSGSTYLARGQIGSQQWLGTPHTIYVESFAIVAQDGTPAMALGDPGWQPYVYDGQNWI